MLHLCPCMEMQSLILVVKKKKKKRSAAVTEHHALLPIGLGVPPWFYATGPVKTQRELIRLPHGSVAACDSQKVYSCLSKCYFLPLVSGSTMLDEGSCSL